MCEIENEKFGKWLGDGSLGMFPLFNDFNFSFKIFHKHSKLCQTTPLKLFFQDNLIEKSSESGNIFKVLIAIINKY